MWGAASTRWALWVPAVCAFGRSPSSPCGDPAEECAGSWDGGQEAQSLAPAQVRGAEEIGSEALGWAGSLGRGPYGTRSSPPAGPGCRHSLHPRTQPLWGHRVSPSLPWAYILGAGRRSLWDVGCGGGCPGGRGCGSPPAPACLLLCPGRATRRRAECPSCCGPFLPPSRALELPFPVEAPALDAGARQAGGQPGQKGVSCPG